MLFGVGVGVEGEDGSRGKKMISGRTYLFIN